MRKTKNEFVKISQCSSRLLSGNTPTLNTLENILAVHKDVESSLLYPTGYMANLGVSSLFNKNSLIFSDQLNHASIIDSCKLSGTNTQIFNHNDHEDLEKKIKQEIENVGKSQFLKNRNFIFSEGIFSMDGDLIKLDEISEIASKYNIILIIDDAHSDFILGNKGNFGGIGEHFKGKTSKKIDVQVSSLSKGLGCFGGYVACKNVVKEYLINKSRQFIYTSSLPDHLCLAAINAISISNKGKRQSKLKSNSKKMRDGLQSIGFSIGNSVSHIVPILIGDEKKTMKFSDRLLKEKGIFVQGIRYPTVKKGQARLRLSLTSSLESSEIEQILQDFQKIGHDMKIV